MVEKVVMYKLTDGRTVATRAEATKEQVKIDMLAKLGPVVVDKYGPNAVELVGVVLSALVNNGWRPPAKKYKKSAPAAL